MKEPVVMGIFTCGRHLRSPPMIRRPLLDNPHIRHGSMYRALTEIIEPAQCSTTIWAVIDVPPPAFVWNTVRVHSPESEIYPPRPAVPLTYPTSEFQVT